jgi:hypothetical protein
MVRKGALKLSCNIPTSKFAEGLLWRDEKHRLKVAEIGLAVQFQWG